MGVLLGLTVTVVTGSMLTLADILLANGNGAVSAIAGSTAGVAVTVPAVIASLAPQYVPVAPSATTLIATSVGVTALLTPFVTAWRATHFDIRSESITAAQPPSPPSSQPREPSDGNPSSHPQRARKNARHRTLAEAPQHCRAALASLDDRGSDCLGAPTFPRVKRQTALALIM